MMPKDFLCSKELDLPLAYPEAVLLLNGFVMEENFVPGFSSSAIWGDSVVVVAAPARMEPGG
jgi:hypothetical protein